MPNSPEIVLTIPVLYLQCVKMKRKCVGSSVAGMFALCCSCSDSFQAVSRGRRHHQGRARRPRPGLPTGWGFATSRSVRQATSDVVGDGDGDGERRPTFVISGPTRLQDFEESSRLLVGSFDEKAEPQSSGPLADLLWNAGITKALIARQYANRYISNARKMRGKSKYSLLVAKSFGTTANNADGENANGKVGGGGGGRNAYGKSIKAGQVIGVAEAGISRYSVISTSNNASEASTTATDVVASIGVICVQDSQRETGVGSELLAAAESIARRRWNETTLHAAVEESNVNALRFFHAAGYEESGLVVEVEVAERMGREKRPHLLLAKRLNTT
mmetsp:Transcript_2382/g.6906  ORF Transcript_2382/g.6906 Transcript_2382/m.6906 type:complete len:332 (-) Transcript_2382:303-1298(-)